MFFLGSGPASKEDFQSSINGLEEGIKRKSLNAFDIGECFE